MEKVLSKKMFRKQIYYHVNLTKSMILSRMAYSEMRLRGLVQEKMEKGLPSGDGLSVLRMRSFTNYFRKWIYDHETRLNRCS